MADEEKQKPPRTLKQILTTYEGGPVGRRGALGIMTLGAAVLATGAWELRKGLKPVYETLGDTSHEVLQADVDAEYVRLYQQISKAKKYAENNGMNFALLMGQVHDTAYSQLHEMMIYDIAARLQITHICKELTQNGIAGQLEEYQRVRHHIIDGLESDERLQPLKDLKNAHPELKHLIDTLTASATFCQLFDATREKTPDIQLANCSIGYQLANGFSWHAGDPERYNKDGTERNRYDPIVETAMVQAIESCGRSSVSSYGIDHLPVLIAGLKNRNSLCLAFDVSNAPLAKEAVRSDDLERLKKEGILHKLVIDGSEPTLTEAQNMVMRASIAHREGTLDTEVKPELDKESADILRAGLENTHAIFKERSCQIETGKSANSR